MKVLALGTCCVDVYPEKEIITPGGEALNIAAQLSYRNDIDVYLMAMLGIDNYAEFIKSTISNLSINTEYLYQTEGPTANQIIKNTRDGDRYFEKGSWDSGVSTSFRFGAGDLSLINEIDIVFITQWEPNLSELVRLKKEKNFVLAVDFDIRRDFSDWQEFIKDIDIFFISGDQDLGQEFQAMSLTTDTLFVMTLGVEGSRVYRKGVEYSCEAIPAEHVVDTTGCGDCYLGNFAVEYLTSGDIHKAMKQASLEAAKVTGYVGGFCIDDLVPMNA